MYCIAQRVARLYDASFPVSPSCALPRISLPPTTITLAIIIIIVIIVIFIIIIIITTCTQRPLEPLTARQGGSPAILQRAADPLQDV